MHTALLGLAAPLPRQHAFLTAPPGAPTSEKSEVRSASFSSATNRGSSSGM